MDILKILEGTREGELIAALSAVYDDIAARQEAWKAAASFSCPDGCGDCCRHFEPDLLECEALYLAAWLLENDEAAARRLLDGDYQSANCGDGCILFEPSSPYHCKVYGGRCLICRLFGYSGDYGKDGKRRWRPCRFYPADRLLPFEHRSYGEEELSSRFAPPLPVMSDFMAQVIALSPDGSGRTFPLREAVVEALGKLLLVASIRGGGGNGSPAPLSA